MIEHCRDFRRVKRLADANPADGLEAWRISISQDVYYLIEVEDGEDVGVWCFEPHAQGHLMHAAMGPKCRGRKAVQSGLSAIGWLFTNTEVITVISAVPVGLKHAHVLPRYAGFRFVCIEDGCRCSVMNKSDYFEMERAA